MAKKDVKPRLVIWVLLLQEFSIEIKNKKMNDNVIADHLSRIETIVEGRRGLEIEESFPDKQLFQVKPQLP